MDAVEAHSGARGGVKVARFAHRVRSRLVLLLDSVCVCVCVCMQGKKASVHGPPAKSIENGKATTTYKWIYDKFEGEALSLSASNQAILWEASEKAVGEAWVVS